MSLPRRGTGGGDVRRSRPREVTLGGLQAVAGSVFAIVLLISTAQQLNGQQMTNTLADLVRSEQAATLGLTVESARTLVRYTIMVLAVLSVASLVLGFYVLRRHRGSRIALTVVGGVVALPALMAGPIGWLVTLYIGVSVFLIWSRPARAWFAPEGGRGSGRGGGTWPPKPGGPPPPDPRFGPPRGPRRDVDGVLPPPEHKPEPPQGPYDGPPPPPAPPPR